MSEISIIVISLLTVALFSGLEIAYLTSNKLRVELGNKKGNFNSRIISFFVKNPTKFYTTTLIGLNIMLVLFSLYFSDALDTKMSRDFGLTKENSPNLVLIIQTAASSLLVLFIGEFLPKAMFRPVANAVLNFFALPLILIYYILWPVSQFVEALSKLILKVFFKTTITEEKPEFTRRDLFQYVDDVKERDDKSPTQLDKQIFKNAITFSERKVRECMVPRTDIVAIEVTADIEEAKALFISSGHSKLPVYRESIDQMIGYIHQIDLYKDPQSIDKIVMPIIITTEASSAGELMNKLIAKRRSLAVVVDEFGGTSGIVTVEDIIEEIIGDIEDEHDNEDLPELQIDEDNYTFHGRHEVSYLNEKYKLSLPEGDYDTLGGLVMSVNQAIPAVGDVIVLPPYELTVTRMDGTRVVEVKICVTQDN